MMVNYVGLVACLLVLSAFVDERSQQSANNTAYEACLDSETALVPSTSVLSSAVEFFQKKSDNALLQGGSMSEDKPWRTMEWVSRYWKHIIALVVPLGSVVTVAEWLSDLVPEQVKSHSLSIAAASIVIAIFFIIMYAVDRIKLSKIIDEKNKIIDEKENEREAASQAANQAVEQFIGDTLTVVRSAGLWLDTDKVNIRGGLQFYPEGSAVFESFKRMYDFSRSTGHQSAERFKSPISDGSG